MIEQEGLLKNYWYAAGTSKELNGNKPIKRIVFDIPIVVLGNRATKQQKKKRTKSHAITGKNN